MIYLVKQKIIGTIEYIVDTDNNPIDEVLGITDRAEPMQSTLDLQYTEDVTVSKLYSGTSSDKLSGEISDPTILAAINKLKNRLHKEDFEPVSSSRTKRKRK